MDLPKKARGRPLLLGKYDPELLDYLKSIREFGGIVNSQIVISSAKKTRLISGAFDAAGITVNQ